MRAPRVRPGSVHTLRCSRAIWANRYSSVRGRRPRCSLVWRSSASMLGPCMVYVLPAPVWPLCGDKKQTVNASGRAG